MLVNAKKYADVLVVAANGRVDYTNAEEFRTALMPHLQNCGSSGHKVVLDFSRLEYISSAGLRVLMIAAKDVRSRKGSLLAVALQPVVREIFEISRFTLVFEIFDSLQDALQKISPEALSIMQAK